MTPTRRVPEPGSLLLLLVAAIAAAISVQARSQPLAPLEDSPAIEGITARGDLNRTYVRPTDRTKIRNYAFDVLGPYPFGAAAIAAGIDQYDNAPPEWSLDTSGYGKRFGFNFSLEAVGTTTRYGLAAAFKEDTLYYRCECSGPFPRLRHAVISTLTGRRGPNGHRVFSFSALAAPYAGSMAAVYGWYPSRYGVKDAFRIGNYSLLEYMGGNIALEFFYTAPRSFVRRMHLKDPAGSPLQGPSR